MARLGDYWIPRVTEEEFNRYEFVCLNDEEAYLKGEPGTISEASIHFFIDHCNPLESPDTCADLETITNYWKDPKLLLQISISYKQVDMKN